MQFPSKKKVQNWAVPKTLEAVLWITFSALLLHYLLAVPRLPVFWYDEAFMVEPAWHLATSGKCVSNLLPDIPENAVFGMNYPLFCLLMAGWIKIFGFSLLTIRLLPFILTFSAALVAVAALCKAEVIRGRLQVLLLLILWMLTHAAFYSSHQARPESLTMLLVSIGLYISSLRATRTNLFALFFLAFLMPFCGLYMIFPISIAAVVTLFFRTYRIQQAVFVLLGIFFGSISFYSIYRWTGAWESFQFVAATVGGLSIFDRLIRIRETGVLPITLIQHAAFWLFSGVLCLLWLFRKKSPVRWSLFLGTSIYMAATVLSIGILANFSIWYDWLCMMPLMVLFVFFAFGCSNIIKPIRIGIIIFLSLLLLDNNKVRYLSSSHLQFWSDSDPSPVEAALKGLANKDDVVIASESAYITLRPNVKKLHSLIYCAYLMDHSDEFKDVIRDSPPEPVSLIVADVTKLHSDLVQPLQDWCGGEWVEIHIPHRTKSVLPSWLSSLPAATDYFDCCNYRVYRRVSRPAYQ